MNDIRFQIIIPTYNARHFTKICIDSIKAQTHINYHALLADDGSDDNTYDNALAAAGDDNRFHAIHNRHNKGALKNIYDAIHESNCRPDDVICLIDGDDYLVGNDALETIAAAYANHNCLSTHGGSYFTGDGSVASCGTIAADVIAANSHRTAAWHCGPPRTFKRRVFDAIDHNKYFKHGGVWLNDCYDQTIMRCILELVGDRFVTIDKPCYRLGMVGRSRGDLQETTVEIIKAQPPLQRL